MKKKTTKTSKATKKQLAERKQAAFYMFVNSFVADIFDIYDDEDNKMSKLELEKFCMKVLDPPRKRKTKK